MKKSMLILTLMVAALCGCAAQQPTTLETPETSVLVEVTPETSSGATPTATPAPTPDPTPVPTAEPTATPTPTAAPTAKPTPAPTEAPAATAAPVQQAEASQQVSMSYGAVPFDLAAGTDQWWSIIRINDGRFFIWVPVMPSSMYCATTVQLGLRNARSVYHSI